MVVVVYFLSFCTNVVREETIHDLFSPCDRTFVCRSTKYKANLNDFEVREAKKSPGEIDCQDLLHVPDGLLILHKPDKEIILSKDTIHFIPNKSGWDDKNKKENINLKKKKKNKKKGRWGRGNWERKRKKKKKRK